MPQPTFQVPEYHLIMLTHLIIANKIINQILIPHLTLHRRPQLR